MKYCLHGWWVGKHCLNIYNKKSRSKVKKIELGRGLSLYRTCSTSMRTRVQSPEFYVKSQHDDAHLYFSIGEAETGRCLRLVGQPASLLSSLHMLVRDLSQTIRGMSEGTIPETGL